MEGRTQKGRKEEHKGGTNDMRKEGLFCETYYYSSCRIAGDAMALVDKGCVYVDVLIGVCITQE